MVGDCSETIALELLLPVAFNMVVCVGTEVVLDSEYLGEDTKLPEVL